jgi:ferritin-like metal-binding protein YciE
MAINTLQEKFLHGIQDIYDAEHQFLDAQNEMLQQANSAIVQRLLEEHIAQTEQQIGVLEQVFAELGEEADRANCAGAAGIVSEGSKLLSEVSGNPHLVDLAIAGSCDKVEHYEIAAYRGLIAAAEAMGNGQVVNLLRRNLEQEEMTAQRIESSTPALLQQAMGRAANA